MGQVVPDNRVKFGDPRIKLSRKIPHEAVSCGIFDRFLNVDNFQPEVHSDVLSGMVVDPTGMKVPVNFGVSRSKCSRDIRLPRFV